MYTGKDEFCVVSGQQLANAFSEVVGNDRVGKERVLTFLLYTLKDTERLVSSWLCAFCLLLLQFSYFRTKKNQHTQQVHNSSGLCTWSVVDLSRMCEHHVHIVNMIKIHASSF